MFTTLLLGGAAWLDFVSLTRWIRLRRTGKGPGGIPVLSWLLYTYVCWGTGQWLLWLGLTGYHLTCHVFIPQRYRLWLESERRPQLR